MKLKKRNKLSFILMILIILMSISPVFAQEQIESGSIYDSVKVLAEQKSSLLVQGYGATSVQYAIISNGEIVLSGNSGVYSRTEDKPITADTMYGIGSVSKMFVTASMMKLVDEGYINLDDPVTEYIPEFVMEDERYMDITIRMLLNHSSGLMGSSLQNSFLFNDNDTYAKDNFLKHLSTQRLKADPGAFSVYCNDGFTLAELVVERVSGISFTKYIEESFIEPLDMKNTKTPMSDLDYSQFAKTYYPTFKESMPIENINHIGTGGIYSTAEDMCLFSQIFMDNPPDIARDILSKESIVATMEKEYLKGMWTPEHDNMLGFGLGWDNVDTFPFNTYEIDAVIKGGDTLLYHASLIILPEYNMSMAVLSSSGASTYNQIFAQAILLEALKAEGHISEIKADVVSSQPNKVELPVEMLEYEGIYADLSMIYKCEISSNGILTLSVPAMPNYPLQTFGYTDDGYFKSEDGSISVGFIKEDNGNIYMINSGYATLPGLGQLATMLYAGQKIEPIVLEDSIQAAWKAREGKMYYVVSEKYTSQNYFTTLPKANIEFVEVAPGYIGSNKIVDENRAIAFVQIPGNAGRDLFDVEFYTNNGIEYAEINSTISISDDFVPAIYANSEAVCTIQDNGFARWFKVGSADVGKTMVVDLPENGAFAVYDANHTCVNFSTITGINTVELTENSMIVFIGDVGTIFNLSFK